MNEPELVPPDTDNNKDRGNMFDMCCPQCGDSEQIDIEAIVSVHLTRDGTDADSAGNGDHYWDQSSPTTCGNCDHCGTVADFEEGAP